MVFFFFRFFRRRLSGGRLTVLHVHLHDTNFVSNTHQTDHGRSECRTHVHHDQTGRRAARTRRQDHQTVRVQGIQTGGHEVHVGESQKRVLDIVRDNGRVVSGIGVAEPWPAFQWLLVLTFPITRARTEPLYSNFWIGRVLHR